MKNAILISLDTLRADHLGCYGYSRCTSPHLDAYAAGGVRFTQAYAQSIPTHPSHTTMFTGRDVMDHQIVRQGGKIDLDPRLPVLAQTLRDAGFYTAAADNLGRWFSRGFVDYEGYKWESEPDVPWRRGEAVNQTALRLLERCAEANAKGEPFFLFVHYWDAHTPYLPPPPFRELFYAGDPRSPAHDSMGPVLASPYFEDYFGAWLGDVTDIEWPKAQYDAGIAYLDACLAVFLRRLDELGLSDSTLVTIVGDHGEELDEHQMYFDHHGLYDTNLHVPLILRHPPTLPAGLAVDGFVRHLELAPTIYDFLDVKAPELPGVSLLPRIAAAARGEALPPIADALYLTECTWMRKRGIRTDRYKLIESLEPDIHNGPPVELYDLAADPAERHNLAEAEPERVRKLSERLRAWRERRLAESGLPDPLETQRLNLRRLRRLGQKAAPDDPRVKERLKNMGYIE